MNFNFPRYIKLTTFAAIFLGGGFYLATRVGDAARNQGVSATNAVPMSPASQIGEPDNAVTGPIASTSSSKTPMAAAVPVKRPNVFGLNGAVQLEDVPEGRFHNELSRLSATSRRDALDKLGRLQVPLNDVASLSAAENGQLFYHCSPPLLPPPGSAAIVQSEDQVVLPGALDKTTAAAAVPIATPPVRHSRPGATKVIYLDFNGYTIVGTA